MCGIAGIVATQSHRHRDSLQRMVASLRHRGPDAHGIHCFDNCILGHSRLSIVDLAGGAQPMLSPTSDAVGLTFNGEIYGYRQLRQQLHPYPFRTCGDTEVILALYDQFGADLACHLPGMFAFALWDDRHQRLIAARDRFGEKPFYYAIGCDGEFIFASEIKAILATGLVDPHLDRDALAHYLQYLYVHPSQSIYREIHPLPPGHLLERDAAGKITVRRYWELPACDETITADQAVEELRHRLDRAVARQLVADVPVGVFLSGGLDSSTITALAAGHSTQVKTFAFGFGDAINELPFAHEVASLYRTDHHDLEDQHSDLADLLWTMARVYDEPFADSSNVPTYLICKLARQHAKVVLSGDGGDELLAGYGMWYRPLLNPDALSTTVAAAHLKQKQYFSEATIRKLGLQPSAASGVVTDANTLDDAMRMDLCDYLPGDILTKIDRASMAHGLELHPFLDVDLAAFCIRLPYRLKIDGEHDKLLLRQAFGHLWPASLHTRSKQGFGAPVSHWLKRGPVSRLKEQYLDDPHRRLFDLLPFDLTREAVRRENYQTWCLLTLALWLEHHQVRP